jgi:hypothetical protein
MSAERAWVRSERASRWVGSGGEEPSRQRGKGVWEASRRRRRSGRGWEGSEAGSQLGFAWVRARVLGWVRLDRQPASFLLWEPVC